MLFVCKWNDVEEKLSYLVSNGNNKAKYIYVLNRAFLKWNGYTVNGSHIPCLPKPSPLFRETLLIEVCDGSDK